MYEHFLRADWNLATAERSMLEYCIDTYSGRQVIGFTVLPDLLVDRTIRRCSTAASLTPMSKYTKFTYVPASFE